MLKGKTVIELTDVNTGQVERFEDKNMVTNAVQDYLNAILALSGASGINNYMPVYKSVLGGIKLFENSIEEDVNNYIIPSVGQNKVIGYASVDAKTNADARRGNLNQQETTAVDNGIQLVWDFATSEANGTISCVCLTSKEGGKGSYNYVPLYGRYEGRAEFVASNYMYTLGYDRTNKVVYLYKDSKVLKCKFTPDIMKLDNKFFEPEIIEILGEYTISDPVKERMLDENTLYSIFANGSRAYEQIRNIHTGEQTSNYYDIENSGNGLNSNAIPCIAKGFIFIPSSDLKKMYKINRANKSDVSLIENEGANLHYQVGSLPNGDISCGNLVIDPVSGANDIIFDQPPSGYIAPVVDYKGFVLMGYVRNQSFVWGTNDLALMTINNLQTPVTKTADKTMKITYTLLYSE